MPDINENRNVDIRHCLSKRTKSTISAPRVFYVDICDVYEMVRHVTYTGPT